MKKALEALNALVRTGVISKYAIGGAVGAMYYIDAVATEDVDAFVFLPASSSGLLDLSPIYAGLRAEGGTLEREYVRFGEWPVQILPDSNDLVREAIREAPVVEFEGVSTWVFTAEHLCAIALQTGRSKDFLRVAMFFEQEQVDRAKLRELALRYALEAPLKRAESLQ